MAENEKIGGVEIGISADFSELDSQFKSAVEKAVKEGSTLGEAIGKATQAAAGDLGKMADAAEKVGDAFSKTTPGAYQFIDAAQKIIDKQKELDTAVIFAKGAIVDIGLAMESGAATATDMARAEENLAAALKRASVAVQEVKPALDQGAESAKGFGDALLKLGAAAGIAAGIKAIAGEAIEAFAQVEKLSLSLQALTGRTQQQVEGDIDALKAFATTVGVAGHSIEEADQRLVAFGVTAAQIPSVLLAEADAAAAMNKNFDTVAASVERMAESGAVAGRSLVALGLNTHDLAQVLGVADEEVKKAFASLDQSQRLEALSEALKKFEGVAQTAAGGVAGSLVNLKTQVGDTFEEIGKAIAPFVTFFASTVSTEILPGIRGMANAFTELSDPAKIAAGALGTVSIAALAIQTIPWVALATSLAVGTAALIAFMNQQDAWVKKNREAGDSLALLEIGLRQQGIDISALSDQYNHGIISQAAYIAQLKELQGAEETEGKESIAQAVARIAAAKAAQKAYGEMVDAETTLHNSVVDLYNTFPKTYEQYVQRLQDGGKTAKATLGEIQSDIQKFESAMEGMSGAPLAAAKAWIVDLERLQEVTKDWVKLDGAAKFRDLARAFETAEMKLQGLRDIKLAQSILPKQWFTDMQEFLKLEDKLQAAVVKFQEQEQGKKEVKQILALPAVQDVVELEKALKHFGLVREQDVQTTLEQNARIQASDILTAREKFEADFKTITEIRKARDAEMQGRLINEIRWKELSGESATQEIINLEKIRIKMQQLYDSTHLLGDLFIQLNQDFAHAFDSLGKAMADNIIDQKNWHDVWQTTIKSIGKMFLEDLIGTVFKALHNSIEETTGLFTKMADVITKGVGAAIHSLPGIPKIGGVGSGEVAKQGGSLPGGSPGDFGGEVTGGTTSPSGGGSSSGGGIGSFSGVMSIASLGVSIASGITQGIQNSRMINLLGEIEISTRQTKEQLTGGIQYSLNTYLPELKHLTDIWGELLNGHLGKIQDILWWGTVNVNVVNMPLGGGANPLGSADYSWSQGQANKQQGENNLGTGGQTGQGGTVTPTLPPADDSDFKMNSSGGGLSETATILLGGTFPKPHVPRQTTQAISPGYSLKPGESFTSGPTDLVNSPGNTDFYKVIPQNYQQQLEAAAKLYGTTPDILRSIIHAEFVANPKAFPLGEPFTPGSAAPWSTADTDKSQQTIAYYKAVSDAQEEYHRGLIDLTTYTQRFSDAQHANSDALLTLHGVITTSIGIAQNTQESLRVNGANYTQLFATLVAAGGKVLPGGTASAPAMGGSATSIPGALSSDQLQGAVQQYANYLQGVQSEQSQQAQFGNAAIQSQDYANGVASWFRDNVVPRFGNHPTDEQLQSILDTTNSQLTAQQVRQQLALSKYDVTTSKARPQITKAYSEPVDFLGSLEGYATRLVSSSMGIPALDYSNPWGSLGAAPVSGGNSYGGNSYITVNALNPSARSTARALSTAIQETGRSTR